MTAALDKVRADAEELTERARAEGRVMVEEAQQLRARVLADLSRRRKVLHAQIEQLRAGRERLAETITDVRRAVDTIAEDLFNAENEARLAAEVAGREDGRPARRGDARRAGDRVAGRGGGADAEALSGVGPRARSRRRRTATATRGPAAAPPVEKVDALFAKLRAAHGGEATDEAAVPGEPAGGTSPDTGPDAGEAPGASPAVETDEEAGRSGDDGPPEARHPLAVQRDELIAPIVTGLSRRLKRSLQDSQNDVLDQLRANGTIWSADLLPDGTEQVDSFATSALPFLEEAADAGASLVGNSKKRPSADSLLAIAHEMAEAVVAPLRRRLADSEGLEGAEESVVTEHVGSAFREWKGERIERLAGDHVIAALSLGTIAVAGKGGIEWVAVAAPGETPCPDCEDNGLNGAQAAGVEFPTGHPHPPAHPGCRCLLAPGTP